MFAPNRGFSGSSNQTESFNFLLDHPCCHGWVGAILALVSDQVRVLGVTTASDLSLNKHVFSVYVTCFYWLRQFSHTSDDQQVTAWGELSAVAGRHFFRAVGSWSLDCQSKLFYFIIIIVVVLCNCYHVIVK